MLILLGVLGCSIAINETCELKVPQDDRRTYTFAVHEAVPDLGYGKEDGQVTGFYPNLIQYICNIMGKKCVLVPTELHFCWSQKKYSQALNNRWWDVCVGFLQNAERRAGYGFVAEVARELASHVYVKKSSGITTLQEIKDSSNKIGFVSGWYVNPSCLEGILGMSLEDRINTDHTSGADLAKAVENGELEAMFIPAHQVPDESLFFRVNETPLYCSLAGASMMVRKDMAPKLTWVGDGFQKLRENGDYQWLCKIAVQGGAIISCFN